MASKHSEQSKCERVAMASAGVGMCGGLRRAGAHLSLRRRIKVPHEAAEKADGWSLVTLMVTEPEAPRRPKWKADRPR